ncbi:MAG: response regulator [Caulobacteraceae bacterium]|nr:response regulator [Caulobacteraceae bacterium]
MTGGIIALALGNLIGWELSLSWIAAYAVAQAIEIGAFQPLLSGARERLPAWRAAFGYLAFFLSGAVFGSVSVPLWLLGGAFGGVMAVLLLSASIVSVVVGSHRSRLAMGLTVTPHCVYLAATPFLMNVLGASGQMKSAVALGCLLFCGYAIAIFRSIDSARTSELAARRDSERKRAEAEAANAAQSTFVATISHELRTPISAMLAGAAELSRTAPDAAARSQAALITDAGRMMKTLLDDILDHAKLEAGRMTVETVSYDVRALCAQVARFWGAEARKKGLRLRVEGAASLPAWVEGDPTRLRQILNNLISNAVKFTREGSITLRLSAWASEEDNAALRFQIVDTGEGMAPDQMARLFTPFEQGDASTAKVHGGTGLGLAISRNLARLMGGHLTAFSVKGSGSVFTLALTLPLAAQPEQGHAHELQARVPLTPAPIVAQVEVVPAPAVEIAEVPEGAHPAEEGDERPVRILVADDHEINRRAVQLVLAPTGALITAVVNGAQAVEAAQVEAFDVIIMDVRMPEMDGREATRRIRAMEGPNQFVPIIAVTADTEDDDKAACRAAGMTDFVGKPIDPMKLLNKVIEAVSGEADDAAASRNVA